MSQNTVVQERPIELHDIRDGMQVRIVSTSCGTEVIGKVHHTNLWGFTIGWIDFESHEADGEKIYTAFVR